MGRLKSHNLLSIVKSVRKVAIALEITSMIGSASSPAFELELVKCWRYFWILGWALRMDACHNTYSEGHARRKGLDERWGHEFRCTRYVPVLVKWTYQRCIIKTHVSWRPGRRNVYRPLLSPRMRLERPFHLPIGGNGQWMRLLHHLPEEQYNAETRPRQTLVRLTPVEIHWTYHWHTHNNSLVPL